MKFLFAFFALFFTVNVHALSMPDVQPSDRNYSSIEKAVNEGFLPLYRDQRFGPDQAVSRRELSIVIDKLSQKIDEQHLQLTQAEMQELLSLTKSFKAYLTTHDTNYNKLSESEIRLKESQDSIQLSNVELNDKVEKMRKQHTWMIIGAIALGGLGLIAK